MKPNQEYLDEFIDDVKVRGWSHWPIKSCEYSINMFNEFTKKNCIEADISDLKKYLTYLKKRPGQRGSQVSPETIRKHFNNLASFFEYLEFEDYIVRSPIPKFRRRYLRNYLKKNNGYTKRQIISIDQMSNLINSILDPQEKAVVCLLAKTGIRVAELRAIDIKDVNWSKYSIKLKPSGKRSNLIVYFDNECAKVLKVWLNVRDEFARIGETALFVNISQGRRMTYFMINRIVTEHAKKLGFHDDESAELDQKFTPHCCRHWFTTHLRRARMPREFIKELRGDSRNETMDIYDHIDEDEIREAYLAHIPQLGL